MVARAPELEREGAQGLNGTSVPVALSAAEDVACGCAGAWMAARTSKLEDEEAKEAGRRFARVPLLTTAALQYVPGGAGRMRWPVC